MKKTLTLLLILSMLFTLTACVGDASNTSTSENVGAITNTTENTNISTDDTQDNTQEGTQETTEGLENTEETTSTDSTISTSKPTEAPSTEPCDHSYYTSGMTDCNGILTYICSKCQHSYGVETGKIDHKWNHYYAKQPTLTEEGISCLECTECHLIETESAGKLHPSDNVYIKTLHCFLEIDSPLNTELYTWQGKAKSILYTRYPDEITEEELFTKWRCWEYNISNDEIQKMKTTSHYNPSNNVFLSYDDGTHPPVLTSYLGYIDNGDGTVTAYASILVKVVSGATSDYVESGFCKIQMEYGAPPTNEQKAIFHITSIIRVESIPTNLTNH